MNELNIIPRIKGAQCLGPEIPDPQLYQLSPITFAIYESQSDSVIVAFASSTLAECLNQLGYPPVRQASIVRYESLTRSNNCPEKAIHLQLLGGKSIVLDSNDTVTIQDVFQSEYDQDYCVKSPTQIWGPSGHPHLDCMLMTPRLVEVINSIAEDGKQQQIAHDMLLDFVAAQENAPIGQKLEISGSAMQFSAKSFRGLLVIFDLIR